MRKNFVILLVILALSGATVFASNKTRDITAFYENIKILFNANEQQLKTESGEAIEPFIVDDSVYVPIRGISQIFGKNVSWDGNSKRVLINHKKVNNISFLGDSITAGSYTDKAYSSMICEKVGATEDNHSVYGALISMNDYHDPANAFVNRYKTLSTNADLIIVMGGTNDATAETYMGTATETTNYSFYGACKNLMAGLKSTYPNADIVFVTPLKYSAKQDRFKWVVNSMKEVAKVYDIPVIDIFNASECDFTGNSEYMGDAIHPNINGHQKMADYIYSQLQALGLI